MSDASVTQILADFERGEPAAAARLLPLIYDELRRLASQRLAREAPGQTLQATALVHEAYLRLLGDGGDVRWDCRGHFFAAAAEAMRRILIENARRKGRRKRGGDRTRVEVDLGEATLSVETPPDELLAVDEAIERLAREDPEAAALVKLRYFAGLGVEEAAEVLGLSRATAYRHWAYARAWVRCEVLGEPDENSAPP